MQFYIVPLVTVDDHRGPKYIHWQYGHGLLFRWNLLDFGSQPTALLLAHNINPAQHYALSDMIDVYAFPATIDQRVTDRAAITPFFEGLHLPTDWLRPATTYRELIRKTAGACLLNQAYTFISGGASLFDTVTLDDPSGKLSAKQRAWLSYALSQLQLDAPRGNQKIRQVIRRAAEHWEKQPILMGGVTI